MKLKDSATLFVHSLTAPNMHELAQQFLDKKKRSASGRWAIDASLSPYDLYVYLKARFGPPNGVAMIVRRPDSDNFIQWHYTLKSGTSYLDIMATNTRLEIILSGYSQLDSDDWNALIRALKQDFATYGSRMTEVRTNLEKWVMFYNPYRRLEDLVNNYAERLSAVNFDSLEFPKEPGAFPPLVIPPGFDPDSDIADFTSKISAIQQAFTEARELSISLRLLTPVWCEAFINFIIFILARPDIRGDDRIYQDYLRKEVDIRVKLLHVNCIGFAKPVDTDSVSYKDFHTLMNARNDLIHGNIDPRKLGYETVYFDGTIPLFTSPQSLVKNALMDSLKGVEPSESLKCVEVVHSFMKIVLESLEPEVTTQVEMLLKERDLGWREATKRVGILFPDYIMEAYGR